MHCLALLYIGYIGFEAVFSEYKTKSKVFAGKRVHTPCHRKTSFIKNVNVTQLVFAERVSLAQKLYQQNINAVTFG